jgi:hypothetical protein
MKQLIEYSKNGYDFKIVHREQNLAIAKGKSRNSDSINWEVIKIQSHNGLTMGGVFMPATEFAPSNNQWGTKGWTAFDEEHAKVIFNKRLQNEL